MDSSEILEKLYKTMVRIRICEESFIGPILRGEVRCPSHLYTGQEAIAAGICASLEENDYVFGNHRSHGHFLAKGCSMSELVAEMFGRETGCSRGRGGSMHLIGHEQGMMGAAPIVAGTISLAMGAALAASVRQANCVSVAFFGDGATGEGVLYECLNFAALMNLPMVFVCENNLYSTHMSIRECRVGNNIYKIAEPFCIESYDVNGNDVLEIYKVGKEAIKKCRKGRGPVFIECLTYRFRGHVGPDDNIQGAHTDIRPREEIERWLQKDPITLFEDYLLSNNLIEREKLEIIHREAEVEVAEAHYYAKNSPHPERKELTNYVFK
jgi:TPP-dependent pyruvate/acetoin dehydrogenase alpha subunit